MRLVIAEKPSVAKSIAAVIGAEQKGDGYIEGGGYVVSWCAGHLLELADPEAYGEQYAKWNYADLPIVPSQWRHVAAKDKAAQLKILMNLMRRPDVDCIINACDAGREGELIFRLVFDHAKCAKPMMRLWISSMEDSAIRTGFDHLKDGAHYNDLYAAASCRERADWLVGISTTRLFTVLYGTLLNAGRVQSPTLAMLVQREADIAAFVKKPFYTPVIDCGEFSANGERSADQQDAEAIRAACDGKPATVRTLTRQKKSASPPLLYDLTTLQREANRFYGYTAQQTLDCAQSLYEKALLSYPRTDSRFITADMRDTITSTIAALQSADEYSSIGPFTPDVDRLINDAKVSDHHALIPTEKMLHTDLGALPLEERDIMNLVIVRLICAAAPPHIYESITAILDCGGYTFTARGKTIIANGWKAFDDKFKAALHSATENADGEDDNSLPELKEGQMFEHVTASLKKGTTTPPKHYTEDTLLSAMETAGEDDMPEDAERKGLGTPATRAAIIEKLVKGGFVERQKKNLVPTTKGKNLVAVLPDTMTSPKLTAEWENALKQVEHGELSGARFMDNIAEFTRIIVRENSAPKPSYTDLFGGEKRNSTARVLGKCPRCGLPVREGAKGYFCDGSSCGFKLWKDSKFWMAKKKPLTADIVSALLKDGRVAIKSLFSDRTKKQYDATVVLDDTGDRFVNFKLDFGERG